MTVSGEKDVDALKRIGRIVANCLQHMGRAMQPGMTTAELDAVGRKFLEAQGARSAPELVYRFPGATCISVNEEVAHGIPGARVIGPGDLVNIDVSAELGGYFADTGGSFLVPPIAPDRANLCAATKRALELALKEARDGAPLSGIGRAIEKEASRHGYTVIRNLGSHGVGRALHEAPEFIPGYFDPSDTRVLREHDVITIEPFLSTGATVARESGDGWTLRTGSRFLSAQYEHTLIVTKGDPIIVTLADGEVA